MKEIENLLTQITAIRKQYDKMAELTGENFNVFKVLGLTTNEVRTHSAFIAELLNPKGSHGQKEVFLKLFCEVLELKDFNCLNAKVFVEKYIDKTNEDYTEGGYIDILLIDTENKAIVIENKIYAINQKNQLFRYYNYSKSKHLNNYTLLYLTLDGKEASIDSKNVIPENVIKNISYNEVILSWLILCKEKAVNHPILRETITQYINLIKHLTGQTMNEDMKKEIVDKIVANGDNFGTALEISNSMDAAKITLLTNFAKKVKEHVNKKFPNDGFDINIDNEFGKRFKPMTFKYSKIENEYIQLSFWGNFTFPYLEIYNKAYEKNPKIKDKKKVAFYSVLPKIGKMNEVLDANIIADWNCNFDKMQKVIDDNLYWCNESNEIAKEIGDEIITVIEAFKKQLIHN
ncbi:MAG: PD-(D/E)XK nuclease family protein [Cytophagales bacterium]